MTDLEPTRDAPATPESRIARVRELRSKPIRGRVVDLIPYAPEYAEATIEMRNTGRAKFFLSQDADLTLESQQRWYETVYLPRDNDIQWLLFDKSGRIVGTNALYDIDIDQGREAEKGRQIVREEFAMLGPYALEADYIACRLSFDDFDVRRVIASVHPENHRVVSMNERMGFQFLEKRELRGNELNYFQCTAESFDDAYLRGILDHWAARAEREAARSEPS